MKKRCAAAVAVTLSQLGRAMVACAQGKAPRSVLEAADILALAR